jgi:DivIVA domain-containing protein
MARKMLLLDIDAILNKQFNIDFKGYSPVEVDQFLDSVVRDYDSYEKMLSEVSDEAEHLKNENTQHEGQHSTPESELNVTELRATGCTGCFG